MYTTYSTVHQNTIKMDKASSANTQFGLELFCIVCHHNPSANGFMSPFSISSALSMTQLGAGGQTSGEMMKALRWKTEDESIIHEQNSNYVRLLQKPSLEYSLSSANRLYIDQSFSVLSDFLEKTKKYYDAEAVSAHFQTNAEHERIDINNWVSQKTQDKIKDLLQEGSVNADTKMVLVNAIYFKGFWKSRFKTYNTSPKPFEVSETQTKMVPTMHSEGSYSFWMDDGIEGFSALEIPYKGGQLSMVILLPTATFGLVELEKSLSFKKLDTMFSRLQHPDSVILYLPKFGVKCSHSMKEPLCKLGMSKAFSNLDADFSRISESTGLVVSEVVHQAFVKVNEEGSEAAAATAVMLMPESDVVSLNPVPSFIVDHPFYFLIRDNRVSNSVLFMGRVVDPSSE